MKTIGLIGGMTWESSKVYYEYANKRVKELLGESHSCPLILNSVDFKEIENLTFANDWKGIGQLMTKSAKQLEAAGAEIVLLCTNTIHLVKDYITEAVNIPFLHIANTTGIGIKQAGLTKVALLGTKFTMEKDFYTNILERQFGLEVIVPNEAQRQVIHNMIYQELVRGHFTNELRTQCLEIINTLESQGAQGVIMGCTELPILMQDVKLSIPSFDTTKLHIYEAINWAIGE